MKIIFKILILISLITSLSLLYVLFFFFLSLHRYPSVKETTAPSVKEDTADSMDLDSYVHELCLIILIVVIKINHQNKEIAFDYQNLIPLIMHSYTI